MGEYEGLTCVAFCTLKGDVHHCLRVCAELYMCEFNLPYMLDKLHSPQTVAVCESIILDVQRDGVHDYTFFLYTFRPVAILSSREGFQYPSPAYGSRPPNLPQTHSEGWMSPRHERGSTT